MDRIKSTFFDFGAAMMRQLPPEFSHDLAMKLLQKSDFNIFYDASLSLLSEGLAMTVPGIGKIDHPIGLAAGFDKNLVAAKNLRKLGFSFMEFGTVTPMAQRGNPKPRLFRQTDQMAIINRMGFNNEGIAKVFERLQALHWNHDRCPIGINVGKNKNSDENKALSDYIDGIKTFGHTARYVVINLSSPNTPGLRDLAGPEFLRLLASEIGSLVHRVFIKLDPDMGKRPFQELVEWAAKLSYQGLILCNTHKIDFPTAGGLSGHPLASISQTRLEWAFEVHKSALTMIASGGIFCGLDVLERIRRGAHAVQIYTSLIYRGPAVIGKMLLELKAEMKLRGIENLNQIFGEFYEAP